MSFLHQLVKTRFLLREREEKDVWFLPHHHMIKARLMKWMMTLSAPPPFFFNKKQSIKLISMFMWTLEVTITWLAVDDRGKIRVPQFREGLNASRATASQRHQQVQEFQVNSLESI